MLSVFSALSVYSAPALEEGSSNEFSGRIGALEKRIEQIEMGEQEISALDEKILTTIEELKIFAHRRPKLVNSQ